MNTIDAQNMLIIGEAGPGESDYTRYDRRVADLACEWLQHAGEKNGPWVLFVSFVTPHYPLLAPQEFYDLYRVDDMPLPKAAAASGFKPHPWLANSIKTTDAASYDDHQHRVGMAAYLGLCSFMDAQLGRVLDSLEANGLRDQTRILYTSDHGENAGSRGMWGKSNHYVGFEPELFDLENDPEELANLADNADFADARTKLEAALGEIVDPQAADRRANEAQKALVESRGGPEQVMANLITTKHYTPVPDGAQAD